MPRTNRAPLHWRTVAAIIAGMSLIGWAVGDVLPWLQKTALVFGVVLLAHGMATAPRPDRDTNRESSGRDG